MEEHKSPLTSEKLLSKKSYVSHSSNAFSLPSLKDSIAPIPVPSPVTKVLAVLSIKRNEDEDDEAIDVQRLSKIGKSSSPGALRVRKPELMKNLRRYSHIQQRRTSKRKLDFKDLVKVNIEEVINTAKCGPNIWPEANKEP